MSAASGAATFFNPPAPDRLKNRSSFGRFCTRNGRAPSVGQARQVDADKTSQQAGKTLTHPLLLRRILRFAN